MGAKIVIPNKNERVTLAQSQIADANLCFNPFELMAETRAYNYANNRMLYGYYPVLKGDLSRSILETIRRNVL